MSRQELIVLVDEGGRPIGSADKTASHHADTPLHLAFSCYLFDDEGRFLATRRSLRKKVWPGVWSNSVCGHPAPGEAMVAAIQRRLRDELGMSGCSFEAVLPRHRYRAPPFRGVVEHEFCPVFVARAESQPRPNPLEVETFEWIAWSEFVGAALADSDDAYSWWCKNQLRELAAQGLVDRLGQATNGRGVMSPLPAASAPPAEVSLAGFVEALLSDVRRPDPTRLPIPGDGLPPAPVEGDLPAADGTAAAHSAPPAPVLGGPTGLGAASLRPPPPSPPVAVSPAPVPPPPVTSSGLGMSASRIVDDHVAPAAEEMPELFCPGAVRDDPALGEEVNERLVAWAEEVGIYPGGLDRLRASDFGRLIMLTHPATDDPDRLLAAAKCVAAEWATDDYYIDEVSLGADPRVVGSRLAKLYAIVDPAQLPARYALQLDRYRREEAIATAFRSAMEHLARYVSVTQLARFQHQMAILFVAWNEEADWHQNARTPPVWEYLVQRHLNSYLPPMILIDAIAGYELAPIEFYDPPVRRAFTLAGDANVLLNDLHSAAFESETDFNLPRVIAVEEGCSQQEAIRRTIEIHNELMHSFVAEAAALSITGSPALQRFFLDTWAWLGGSREWHATSGRYHDRDD